MIFIVSSHVYMYIHVYIGDFEIYSGHAILHLHPYNKTFTLWDTKHHKQQA